MCGINNTHSLCVYTVMFCNILVTDSSETFGYPTLRDEILGNPETTISLLMQILHGETEIVDTNTTHFVFTQEFIIASALGGAAAILVTTTLVCLCCCYYRHKNK